MKTTDIRGSCPYCYRRMIKATDVFTDEAPMHGDLAFCASCGEVAIFDFRRRKNSLRRPTAQERLEIDRNPSAIRLLAHQRGQQHELPSRSHH